jgi:hypothetical protein
MRLAITRGACLLGTCGLLMISSAFITPAEGASPGETGTQCVAVFKASSALPAEGRSLQVGHDARTNATFFFSLAKNSGVRMTVKAGDLEAEKTVYPDGRFRIAVRAGDDRFAVVFSPAGIDVERQSRRRHIDLDAVTDDDWLRVKVLVAGSRGLRLFRTLANTLDPATLETPAGTAILLSDAVLGLLDGDVGAVGRLGRQMRVAYQARIRPVALGQEFLQCYRKYEAAVDMALMEYGECTARYWSFDPRQYLCDMEWLLKAESAWFQFLSCSAIPMKTDG